MSQPTHTYGPTCHLAKSVASSGPTNDDVPGTKAQFFYFSPLPVDDPLSTAPPIGSDSKSTKHDPRPFSAYDNNNLEDCWLGLGSEKDRKYHNKGRSRKFIRPFHNDRSRSAVGTLALAAKMKDRVEEGATSRPDPKDASRPSSKMAKSASASRLSADASSEQPLKAPSPSKKSPEASTTLKLPYGPPPANKSENAKETPSPSTKDNEAKASPGKMNKSEVDRETSSETSMKGNPFNPTCDDLDHVPLDFKDDAGKPSHTEPTPSASAETQKGEAAKPTLNRQQGNFQGDATNDTLSTKVSGSLKERIVSQLPALESSYEFDSKEHKELEKHGNFKSQKPLENHLKSKHSDVKNSERTARNKNSLEKNPTLSPPSDFTNHTEQGNGAGTTGRPFLKLPSRSASPQPPLSYNDSYDGERGDYSDDPCFGSPKPCYVQDQHDSTEIEAVLKHNCKAYKNTKEDIDVPVGVSRLHKVSLPALQMKPIYWSPVSDVAPVIRGTWFYKDTMYPVEPPVANQLEMGYRELRPWSQTWKDEIHSAIEVGSTGEEKIAHPLWPTDADKHLTSDDILSADPYCAAKCFQGEAAAEGTADFDGLGKKLSDTKTIAKKYPNHQVIYKDSRHAFILKQNLQPSAYYKRKPVQKIVRRGLTVGIHVVRGFDWKSWEVLHPSKKINVTTKAEEHAAVSGNSESGKRNACVACRSQEEQKKCTDLVLVVHGIGQKLSERVESFHFTLAINSFRRAINVELCNEAVQKVLRDDLAGIMVLPVNWRSNLSFDGGDPMKEGENGRSGCDFSLKDITPDTIPAVRSLISDVMLDIPYYMSNNKTRMIQALISEANRVYRLWCKNNPEFHKNGRVHIIAHSLGSAMTAEILSKQPTLVPKVDISGKKPNTKHFDFNTTNLFFVGSPAGFFLLLEKGKLIPRRGQGKPGRELGTDEDRSIVGEQGMFGCLAVDNIYNIMHQNDPIAYRLNACADPLYAASLKSAQVPSATTGFFESIGNAMKIMTPGFTTPSDLAVGQMAKPPIAARMPSQLEMEVHDFTAEEKAEKKFCLLNENGQVDYCLTSGGGPLEIQYLNMLSAHSSYWTNHDFIRMLVIEVGRKPGRRYCLPNMKAVKIRHKF